MRLLIFTTELDDSGKAIKIEAEKILLKCKLYFYNNLVYFNGFIFHKTKKLKIEKIDKIILRSPYHSFISTFDYLFFARKLIEEYSDNILLDKEYYLNFPDHRDKLSQADFFYKNKVSTPKTFFAFHKADYNQINKFPVIVKKRKSSCCRDVFIITSQDKLNLFFKAKNLADYLIQEKIKVKKDLRILILKNKVLGVVERKINYKPNNKIGVKVNKVYLYLPEKVKNQAINIAKKIYGDFVGIDVVLTENNKFYFIEVNLAPQFSSFSRVSNINVAKKIVMFAKKHLPKV